MNHKDTLIGRIGKKSKKERKKMSKKRKTSNIRKILGVKQKK